MTPEQEAELARIVGEAAEAITKVTTAIAEWWETGGPKIREMLGDLDEKFEELDLGDGE